jgi:hypothetical protein
MKVRFTSEFLRLSEVKKLDLICQWPSASELDNYKKKPLGADKIFPKYPLLPRPPRYKRNRNEKDSY